MSDNARLSQLITHFDVKSIKKFIINNDNKADMNYRDIMFDLQTPLMRMCHFKTPQDDLMDLYDLMLAKVMDINIQDREGCTLLAHACIAENTYLIETLASSKHITNCDPNIEDNVGWTPLFHAVKSRNPTIVALLLEEFVGKGLNVNHTNHAGITALQEAENRCDREICHLLKTKGQADLNQVQIHSRELNDLKKRRSPTPKQKPPQLKKRSKKLKKREAVVNVTNDFYNSNDFDDYHSEDADDSGDVFTNEADAKPPKISTRERQNSFSLPDLRANSSSLVSTSPSSASFQSDYSLKNISSSGFENKNDDMSDNEKDDIVQRNLNVNHSSNSSVSSSRTNSVSLPELRLDLRKPPKHQKQNIDLTTPTITPRLQTINSSRVKNISSDTSSTSIVCNSLASIGSQKSHQSASSVTLPQIDSTPRVGLPAIDCTDNIQFSPRKGGNITNRGNKTGRRKKLNDTESSYKLYNMQVANHTV